MAWEKTQGLYLQQLFIQTQRFCLHIIIHYNFLTIAQFIQVSPDLQIWYICVKYIFNWRSNVTDMVK